MPDPTPTPGQDPAPTPEPGQDPAPNPAPTPDPPAGDPPNDPEPGQDPAPEPDGDTFPRDYVEQLRRESAQHRTTAREAQANVEALNTRASTAEARVAELERDLASTTTRAERFEVAAEVGVPLTLAPRLIGDTREALVEDARRLLADVAPVPSFDGGPRGGEDAPVDMNAAIRRAAGRA